MGYQRIAAVVVAVSVFGVGCSESKVADEAEQTTTTAAPKATALAERLAAVTTGDLVMGDAFNRDLLRLGFKTVGFTDEEARCSSGAIADARGADFGSLTVSSLFDQESVSPELLTQCLDPERMQEVGIGGAPSDIAPEAAGEFSQLMSGLAAAGYESAGLTASESSCLVSATAPEGGVDVAGGVVSSAPSVVSPAAVSECISEDRIAQLAP